MSDTNVKVETSAQVKPVTEEVKVDNTEDTEVQVCFYLHFTLCL